MLKKAFIALVLLGVCVALVMYVYPAHPVVVWALLGLSVACYRLSRRAQSLFGRKDTQSRPYDEENHPYRQDVRNPGELTHS